MKQWLILIFTFYQVAYFYFFALWSSAGLLGALLPLFGFAPFYPIDSKFDAGRCMLGGSIGDGGGRYLFVTTLSGTALSSYKKKKSSLDTGWK